MGFLERFKSGEKDTETQVVEQVENTTGENSETTVFEEQALKNVEETTPSEEAAPVGEITQEEAAPMEEITQEEVAPVEETTQEEAAPQEEVTEEEVAPIEETEAQEEEAAVQEEAPTDEPAEDAEKVEIGAPVEETVPAEEGESVKEDEEVKSETISPEDVLAQFNDLKQMIEQKIMIDTQKKDIIDQLSREAEGYREEFFKKMFKPIIMDIIEVTNDLQRMVRTYKEKPEDVVDKKKFISIMDCYQSDLEDILEKYSVEVFNEEGEMFNGRTQKSVKIIDTGDESKHKTIAQRLVNGYTLDGKVIAAEKVNVYKYNPELAEQEKTDEGGSEGNEKTTDCSAESQDCNE